MTATSSAGRLRESARGAGWATRATLGRRDGRAVFAATFLAYLAGYLWVIGDLAAGTGTWGVFVVETPLARASEVRGPFRFGAVARLDLGPAILLVAPLTDAVAVVIAGLVAVNVAVSYLAWRQPAACGIGASAGLFAGLPALLSGSVCCGPALLLVLGVQATAGLVAAFAWLVPVAALLLVGSLLLVGRRVHVDPGAAAGA